MLYRLRNNLSTKERLEPVTLQLKVRTAKDEYGFSR